MTRNRLRLAVVLSLVVFAAWWRVRSRDAEVAPAVALLVATPAPAPAAARAPEPARAPVAAPTSGPTDDRRVVCAAGPPPEGRTWEVFAVTEGEVSPVSATWEGSRLSFEPPTGTVAAFVMWGRDTKATTLALVPAGDGRECVVGDLPPPTDAPLFGKVRGAADLPDGTVFLEGCGARDDDPVDADGGFFVQGEPGRCSMRAWRQAGALRLPGPWVEVDAVSGVEKEVEISVPTFEPAGVGMGIEAVDGGIAVTFLVEGGPGALAGLAVGDVVTSVNGVSTSGMDLEDYIQQALGPPGSSVRLEGVGADGQPFDVSARRAIIEPGR